MFIRHAFGNFFVRWALIALSAVGGFHADGTAQAPDLAKMDIVQRSVPDGPVAIVRSTAIERDAYLGFYENELISIAEITGTEQFQESDRIKVGLRCLAKMIQREILYQEASRRGLKAADDEIQKAYDHDIAVLKGRFERKDGQPTTDQDVERITGQTLAQIRESVRRSLLIDKAFDAIAKELGVSVTQDEVKKFRAENSQLFQRPDTVHLRQIYIKPKPNPKTATEAQWNEARAELEKALARVRAGEMFETVAKAMSQSPDADKGGDMGLVPAAQLPPFYQDAIKGLKEGEISAIVKSEFGLHIVQFLGSEGGREVSAEEAEPRIREVLQRSKAETSVATWCEPIVNDPAQVKIFLHLEQTLSALTRGEEGGAEAKSAGVAPAQTSPTPAEKAEPAESGKKKKKK